MSDLRNRAAGARAVGPAPCARRRRRAAHFDGTCVLGTYAPPRDGLIAALKFHARLDIGRGLGAMLADGARGLPLDAIVPLPLSPQRLREHGYS